jgi:molecular chaperone DnaK
VGIPPAPRGIPQIEVTFDIDANGIVHVSAKDMGTGKEQSIKIQASSGLSEEEIQKKVKDAEAHAEDDKKKKALVEARNKADQMIYTTEKTLKDYGDKVSADEKKNIEEKLEKVKQAVKGENAEEIDKSVDELMQASHKLAEEMYKQTDGAQQQAGPQEPPKEEPKEEKKDDKGKDGAVDADFEVVDDK